MLAVQAAASGGTSRHELSSQRDFGAQLVYQVTVSPFHRARVSAM